MQAIPGHVFKLLLAAALCGGAMQQAAATVVTVTGTLFDVQYDDVQLNPSSGQFSLFGAPTIVGSNIIFQPNNMFALSTPANQADAHKTFNFNMDIVPKAGMHLQVSALSLAELGDFTLTGSGSNVHVGVGATLVGPIVIGESSKVMAGCFVRTSVPPRSLVEAPAPIVRPRGGR